MERGGDVKRLTPFTAFLVLLIAIAGFALSYQALYEYALANGVRHELAWLWPLVIDGFMIVISLSILRASLNQEPVRYLWSLAMLATLVSIAFNIAHAPATFAGRAVATVAPVAMFLAFEVFIVQIKRNAERRAMQGSYQALQEQVKSAQGELSKMQAQGEKMQEHIKSGKDEVKRLQAETKTAQAALKQAQAELLEAQAGDTKGKLIAFYMANPRATQDTAAQAVGTSRARVGQILQELHEALPLNGKVHKAAVQPVNGTANK